MGGIFETDKMLKHVAGCAQCKATKTYADRCDIWSDMYNNVVDFECGEGPFEDKPEAVMCNRCDGAVTPDEEGCKACGYTWAEARAEEQQ
jgi:hypothetical protein